MLLSCWAVRCRVKWLLFAVVRRDKSARNMTVCSRNLGLLILGLHGRTDLTLGHWWRNMCVVTGCRSGYASIIELWLNPVGMLLRRNMLLVLLSLLVRSKKFVVRRTISRRRLLYLDALLTFRS